MDVISLSGVSLDTYKNSINVLKHVIEIYVANVYTHTQLFGN